jgi:hypothetical protein
VFQVLHISWILLPEVEIIFVFEHLGLDETNKMQGIHTGVKNMNTPSAKYYSNKTEQHSIAC